MVTALAQQRAMLENILRACVGLAPKQHDLWNTNEVRTEPDPQHTAFQKINPPFL